MQRALVERARDGDLDAFTQLVKVAFPRLEGVAHLILRDTDRAQEAVQDALVLAWRDLRALRDPEAWDAWLRRLTVRACYKVARKERRQTLVALRGVTSAGPTGAQDATADVAERDWVLDELGRIHIDQRAVIVLHYFVDLPIAEVAEIIGIPYGTAASRLHRGLAAMRESMRAGPGADGAAVTERSR
jgi:RNA polymerase sigma-70 factor (ECF subfamily)